MGLLGGVLQKITERRRAMPHLQQQIERLRPKLEAYGALCGELGEAPSDVALAWLLHNPAVTAAISGPRTVEQLHQNLKAPSLSRSGETLAKLDEIWPGPRGKERDGKTTVTRRCFLCSRLISAAEFAQVVRSRRQIANSLHWVLEVIFGDDHARVRQGYGARNMSLIKRIAVNLFKSAKDRNSLKLRRKKAA
jgi:predicted transposase YbfD/YdcC